ncbi:MAG: biotin--[acetyl-CoA-carboxylase] ligase [Wenzhouxiangella sp.]
MEPELQQLLNCLSDGGRHSGRQLAERFGISRAAVWKRIERLRALGLAVDAVPGGGYQLSPPDEWLDADAIQAAMRQPMPVSVVFEIGSTNDALAVDAHSPAALLAETQTAGRGRRGRSWLSPPGSGLYLSLAWRFESGLGGLGGLSLAAGLAAAETLRDQGLHSVRLKWPNDLMVNQRKLGGLLVDVSGSADGPCRAIIGLGLNVRLPEALVIDQAATDLHQQGIKTGRNRLAGQLISALVETCETLDRDGFGALLPRWQALDELAGQPVRATAARGPAVEGRCCGVDHLGRLGIETDQGLRWISGGEISVRRR